MRALVLGGGGFIGTNVCRHLLKAGYEVRAFGRHFVDRNALGTSDIVEGDFNDETVLATALQSVDVVIHSVHATFPPAANVEMVGDVSRSVIGTIKMLEAARSSGVKKIVFFSSGGTVYGTPRTIPIAECHPTDPIGAYGINKLFIEKYIGLFEHLYGIDGYILRIANPYGKYQLGMKQQGLIPNVYSRLVEKKPVTIFGDGSNVRDYVYIDDACEAVLSVLDYSGSERCFNVGSAGPGKTIREVVDCVSKESRIPAKLEFMPARSFDVPANVLDCSRIFAETGWKPKTDFADGIHETVAWLERLKTS